MPETRRITVHEALTKLKIYEKRIRKLMDESTFIDVKKTSENKIGGVPLEEYQKTLKSNYDKLNDLITEMNALKAALSRSNSATYIQVGGNRMTVAEAIYYWHHGINIQKELLLNLTSAYQTAVSRIENENGAKLDSRAEMFISSIYGSKDKADPKLVNEMLSSFKESNKYELVNPVKLEKRIEEMQEKIDLFESSVDSALQTSNATTILEYTV